MFVDHFVWVTSGLLEEIDRFSQVFGVSPVYGGSHPGKGTHNALLDLGHQCYLELLAPDPDQTTDDRWMIGQKPLDSGLIHWAWRTMDLNTQWKQCNAAGWTLGPMQAGQRLRLDQSVLEWKLTNPDWAGSEFQPFLIEWSSGQHPTDSLGARCQLRSIAIQHPTPESLTYASFMPEWPQCSIRTGPPLLAIYVETPRGSFVLQSNSDRIFDASI